MDSFRESVDSYRIVDHKSCLKKIRIVPTKRILILGFVSFRFVTKVFKYLYRGFVSQTVFDKIRPFFTNPTNPTNPHESLLHRQTTNPYESWGPDSRIPTVFKRFVSWIRFVVRCSKDLFRGFVLYNGVQKIRFVDSFRKTKNLKRFDSFCFGRIRIRIPHPYFFLLNLPFSRKGWPPLV